jgi:hypothetical protein
MEVDLDLSALQKEHTCRITKLSSLFKIFSLYTNTFFLSSWQVTDAAA